MKQKVAISVIEFDEQYDVEVYRWVEVLQIKGDLIDDLSEYGFDDQDEAIEYIKDIKENLEIVSLNQLSEDDFEETEINFSEDDFWYLVHLSLEQETFDKQIEWLIELLSQMPKAYIEAFHVFMSEIEKTIHQHENRQAACTLAGVCGDDSTLYFCRWLISRGKNAMEEILLKPQKVTKYVTDGKATNEAFGYVAYKALEQKEKHS